METEQNRKRDEERRGAQRDKATERHRDRDTSAKTIRETEQRREREEGRRGEGRRDQLAEESEEDTIMRRGGDGAQDALLHLLRVHRPHKPPEPAHLLRLGGVAALVDHRGLPVVHVELRDARDQQLDVPDRAELAQAHAELVADEDREALDHSVDLRLDGVEELAVHKKLHVFLCSQFLI